MSTFNKGDVVQLKSGGPQMTIGGTSQYDDSSYYCDWFVNDEIKSGYFYGEQLKIFNLTTEEDD